MTHWTTADGEKKEIIDLSSDHLRNIVKFSFSQNTVPTTAVFTELAYRRELADIGDEIEPGEGYKSPEEIRASHSMSGMAGRIKELEARLAKLEGQK